MALLKSAQLDGHYPRNPIDPTPVLRYTSSPCAIRDGSPISPYLS